MSGQDLLDHERCVEPLPGLRVVLDRGRTYRWISADAARRERLLKGLEDSGLAATVSCDDALIANLRAWENIVLPLHWRRAGRTEWMESRARALLAALDWSAARIAAFVASPPDALTPLETRVAGLARALLAEPEILVLDRVAFGLEQEDQAVAMRFAEMFLRFFPFRAVVQVESEAPPGTRGWLPC